MVQEEGGVLGVMGAEEEGEEGEETLAAAAATAIRRSRSHAFGIWRRSQTMFTSRSVTYQCAPSYGHARDLAMDGWMA